MSSFLICKLLFPFYLLFRLIYLVLCWISVMKMDIFALFQSQGENSHSFTIEYVSYRFLLTFFINVLLTVFISFYWSSKIPLLIVFFLFGISFSYSFRETLLMTNPLHFSSLRMSCFQLHSWKVFLLDKEMWVESIFL